jgi:hypothetical protein
MASFQDRRQPSARSRSSRVSTARSVSNFEFMLKWTVLCCAMASPCRCMCSVASHMSPRSAHKSKCMPGSVSTRVAWRRFSGCLLLMPNLLLQHAPLARAVIVNHVLCSGITMLLQPDGVFMSCSCLLLLVQRVRLAWAATDSPALCNGITNSPQLDGVYQCTDQLCALLLSAAAAAACPPGMGPAPACDQECQPGWYSNGFAACRKCPVGYTSGPKASNCTGPIHTSECSTARVCYAYACLFYRSLFTRCAL